MVGLTACGGGPTPQPEAPVATVDSLYSVKVAQKDMARSSKRFVVLGKKALPDEDVLETVFAKKATMAEVGPSPKGVEIALPGVLCSVEPTSKPASIPRHFLPEERDPHALPEAEAKGLAETSVYYDVVCELNVDVPLRALPEQSEKTATVVAELTDGWIHDRHTGRYWPRDAWTRSRAKSTRYEIRRLIRVISVKTEQGDWLLETRGMAAFGRPDMAFYPVSEDYVAGMKSTLLTLSDLMLASPRLGSGSTIDIGAVTAGLVDRAVYRTRSHPDMPRLLTSEGISSQTLVLCGPKVELGSKPGYKGFLRQIMVR